MGLAALVSTGIGGNGSLLRRRVSLFRRFFASRFVCGFSDPLPDLSGHNRISAAAGTSSLDFAALLAVYSL